MDRFSDFYLDKGVRRPVTTPEATQANREAWVRLGEKLQDNAESNKLIRDAYNSSDKDPAKLANAVELAGSAPNNMFSKIGSAVKDYFSAENKEQRDDASSTVSTIGNSMGNLANQLGSRTSSYRPTVNPAPITQGQMMQKNTVSDANCKVSYRVGSKRKGK